MKPKNPFHAAALTLITIALSAATSQAAILAVNATTGNFAATAANNGANTIAASGGTNPAPYSVTVASGTNLTGSAGNNKGIDITVGGYTIDNAGTLTGTSSGIRSDVAGVSATVNNALTGTISGNNDAINLLGDGVVIQNGGTITALSGSDAIEIGGGSVTNTNTITGGYRGVAFTGGANDTLTNSGTITSVSNAAVEIGATSANPIITNSGTITSGNDGINIQSASATVTNSTTGTISGTNGSDGLEALTDLTLNNSGSIVGGNSGVTATTGASITNQIGAFISAANNSVAIADGVVINYGTITATAGTGILATGNTDSIVSIGNGGTVSGATGIAFTGVATQSLGVSNGTVTGTGGTAISLGDGDSATSLSQAAITGDIIGGAGTDNLAIFNNVTVNGNVSDIATLTRSLTPGLSTINGTTEADTINVSSSSLYLNGNVSPDTAAMTTINLSDGELGGIGTWTADINQSGGLLTPGTTPGIADPATAISQGLTIDGNLNQTGGALLVHFDPVTPNSDRITITGDASISGSSIYISPTTQDAPLQDGSTDVLWVNGNRTGQYSNAIFYFENGHSDADGLAATAGNGLFNSSTVSLVPLTGTFSDDVALGVFHHYQTVAGLGTFGQDFGTHLNTRVADSLDTLTYPGLAEFLGFLDYSDAATVACVMNAYEPVALQASQIAMARANYTVHRIVEGQNQLERLYPTEDIHLWGNFNYDSVDGNATTRGTVGIGTVFNNLNIGILASIYNQSDLDFSTHDADLDSVGYGLYLGTGDTLGWQWNAYIGGFNGSTSSKRYLDSCPEVNLDGSYSSDLDGIQALLSGAYMMERGCTTWGPTFGLEYTKVSADDITIKPGTDLPSMAFSPDDLTSTRLLLGVRAEFELDSSVKPYLSAQWAHEFDGESGGYTATFYGKSFSSAPDAALSEDSLILRAGIYAPLGENVSLDLGYLGELSLGDHGADSHGLNLGLRAQF